MAQKQGKQSITHSPKERMIVLNVFKYFRNKYPDKLVSELIQNTSKATGCRERHILEFYIEEYGIESLQNPHKQRSKEVINTTSRDVKYSDSVRNNIWQIAHNYKCTDRSQFLNSVLAIVNADPHLPYFTKATLRRLLLDIGFKYKTVGNKCVLVEMDQDSDEDTEITCIGDYVTDPILFVEVDERSSMTEFYSEDDSTEFMAEMCETKPILDEIVPEPFVIEMSQSTRMYINHNEVEIDEKPTMLTLNIEKSYGEMATNDSNHSDSEDD